MNKFSFIGVLVLVLAISGCSTASNSFVEKSTLKACQLQAELFTYGTTEANGSIESAQKIHEMSIEIANTAEEDVAINFWYQVDFFKALADPNTQSGWEPSQEMTNANGEIARICQTYGITF